MSDCPRCTELHSATAVALARVQELEAEVRAYGIAFGRTADETAEQHAAAIHQIIDKAEAALARAEQEREEALARSRERGWKVRDGDAIIGRLSRDLAAALETRRSLLALVETWRAKAAGELELCRQFVDAARASSIRTPAALLIHKADEESRALERTTCADELEASLLVGVEGRRDVQQG